MTQSRQWLINGRPVNRPLADDDFKLVTVEVPDPGKNEVQVKARYFGFDPAQKGWMENIADYVAPTEIGEVMRGSGTGEVIASNSDHFKPGDRVTGLLGWQEIGNHPASALEKIPADDPFEPEHLGVLGIPGVTAYFGFLRLGKPVPGDTVLISGAAGATGSVVGQIARIGGCRVVGIAGGPDKCDWLTREAGFDAAIDYKAGQVKDQIKEHCPAGVDVFFDNVGGTILNDALGRLANGARVVICGGISRYQTGTLPEGPQNYFNLVFRRASMEGFIVLDYAAEFPQARKRLRQWIGSGALSYQQDIQHGFENAPETLARLFVGKNFGKQILKL